MTDRLWSTEQFQDLLERMKSRQPVLFAWERESEIRLSHKEWAELFAEGCAASGITVEIFHIPRKSVTVAWDARAEPDEDTVHQAIANLEQLRSTRTRPPKPHAAEARRHQNPLH